MPSTPAARGLRCNGRSCSPTRTKLCGSVVRSLQQDKEELRAFTLEQRQLLKNLDQDCEALRKDVIQADIARTSLACESCASRCAMEVAQQECRQFVAERCRLEEELSSWQQSAVRFQDACEVSKQREAERCCWEHERRSLEKEVMLAKEELYSLDEATHRQSAEMANISFHQSQAKALREDALQQRSLREEAERQWRAAQKELASLREKTTKAHTKADVDQPCLVALRANLSRESEERQRHASEVQLALSALDAMRRELQDINADNLQLRTGLQRSLKGLESIERRSVEAEFAAVAALPGLRGRF